MTSDKEKDIAVLRQEIPELGQLHKTSVAGLYIFWCMETTADGLWKPLSPDGLSEFKLWATSSPIEKMVAAEKRDIAERASQ